MSDASGALKVVRASEASRRTGQSNGALRVAGIDEALAGATQIWMGRVSNDPGHRSVAHHHGEAQTAGYCLQGQARIYFGEDFTEFVDLDPGDFVYVPPFFPHIEANRSDERELVWITARSPRNIVVNLA